MTPVTKNNISSKKSGFFIGMTCPGCAGELELDDDFFVIHCRHCGSVHRLEMPDTPPAFLVPVKSDKREARFSIDRYLKENHLPLTDSSIQLKRLYYPYWKIDAILFRYRKSMYRDVYFDETTNSEEIISEKEHTDVNLTQYTTTIAAGCNYDGIPVTLGLRTDYIKMLTYSNENINEKFFSYPVVKSWDEIRNNLKSNLISIGTIDDNEFGVNKTELFNPKAALIYFPYYVFESFNDIGFNRYVIDGVTGRLVDHVTETEIETELSSPKKANIEFGSITIEQHRCSNCGEDLPPEQSYVYICSNCRSLQILDSSDFSINQIFKLEGESLPENEFFPFWSLKMSDKDAARLRPSFGGLYASDRLVIPAFRVHNLDAMFKLAKRMSSALPRMNIVPLIRTGSKYHQINLPLSEAIIEADVFIHRDLYAKSSGNHNAAEPFLPVEAGLFYAPFHPQNYFYVDSVINAITFEKRIIS